MPKISINFVEDKKEGKVRLFVESSVVMNEEGINISSGFGYDSVSRDLGSGALENCSRIVLNYPFIFFIRDMSSKITLLSGAVQKFNETKTYWKSTGIQCL